MKKVNLEQVDNNNKNEILWKSRSGLNVFKPQPNLPQGEGTGVSPTILLGLNVNQYTFNSYGVD